jgi:hypothetical protein
VLQINERLSNLSKRSEDTEGKPVITLSRISISLAVVGLLVCAGCGSSPLTSSPIGVVKNGVLTGYESTTVGKAFEGTFQNAKWTTFETPKGATVVEFNGTLKPKASSKWHISESHGGVIDSGITVPQKLLHPIVVSCINKLGLDDEMKQEAKANDYWLLGVEYWMLRQEGGHPERIAKIKSCINESVSIPVSFQFTLSSDKKEFKLSYIDQPIFAGQEEEALAFVYH